MKLGLERKFLKGVQKYRGCLDKIQQKQIFFQNGFPEYTCLLLFMLMFLLILLVLFQLLFFFFLFCCPCPTVPVPCLRLLLYFHPHPHALPFLLLQQVSPRIKEEIQTAHRTNIFSAQFLPETSDLQVTGEVEREGWRLHSFNI